MYSTIDLSTYYLVLDKVYFHAVYIKFSFFGMVYKRLSLKYSLFIRKIVICCILGFIVTVCVYVIYKNVLHFTISKKEL